MNNRRVYNPYLPVHEYIPDGEPHVFGDRVYIFGSHDKEGGYTYCMLDYVTYSAPVDDLTDWRYEGVIYKASQDPQYPKYKYMFAPDVVRGNDGKYYLYYSMSGDYGVGGYIGPMSVAVSDKPEGPYEFVGFVQNKDGTPLNRYVLFDPAVMNDDGVIRLYYGTQYGIDSSEQIQKDPGFEQNLMNMFGRTREQIRSYPDNIMGPVMAVLEDDMITVKQEPHHIIPYHVKGTSFEKHPFFEGASMRKVKDKYYFIYSSWLNHELCYAVSDRPDGGFEFGGTVISNGDVGLNGRCTEERLNMTGTTHGSIIEINGDWYVFYHRLTHKSDYSRQSCAEKISIGEDGRIEQVEVTSCGLNGGPLPAQGEYPSVIACNLTNGNMPHGSNSIYKIDFPNVTNLGEDRFIGSIEHGTLIGYKYFRADSDVRVGVEVRMETDRNKPVFSGPARIDERNFDDGVRRDNYASADAADEGFFEVRTKIDGEAIAVIPIDDNEADDIKWNRFLSDKALPAGEYAVFLVYHGKKKIQFKTLLFIKGET